MWYSPKLQPLAPQLPMVPVTSTATFVGDAGSLPACENRINPTSLGALDCKPSQKAAIAVMVPAAVACAVHASAHEPRSTGEGAAVWSWSLQLLCTQEMQSGCDGPIEDIVPGMLAEFKIA